MAESAPELDEETLRTQISAIVDDYSKYMQGKIDAMQLKESIGFQLNLLEKFEYKKGAYDCRSRVVMPKHSELVDLSLLLSMKRGVARYVLTLRHEGARKYAVHENRLVYVDLTKPPSKIFDKESMAIHDARVATASSPRIEASESQTHTMIRIPSAFKVKVRTTPQPRYGKIVCPTNNDRCCYLGKSHPASTKCGGAHFKCCIGEIHYGKD